MGKIRPPSPAMVMACIALAVALSGVTYAAANLPRNSVGPNQLKRNAVTETKIKNNAVTGAKVKETTLGQVPSALNAANADKLDGKGSSDFLAAASVRISQRIAVSNPNNQTVVEKPLIDDGTFRIFGECARNNLGNVQAEVWARTSEVDSLADTFGNGTDGSLARSREFDPGQIVVLALAPSGRLDARAYFLVAPNGKTLTGMVSGGAAIGGADCVFAATGVG